MKTNSIKVSIVIAILLCGCGKIPTALPNQTFESFVGNFEAGTIDAFHLLVSDARVNTVIVGNPVRKGNFALKNTLRPNDFIFNGYRAELAVYNCAKYHTEVYYGFGIMIDTSYSDQEYNLICQWQDLPDYRQGEDWEPLPILRGSPPPLALVYVNGAFELKMNVNPNSGNETFIVGSAQPVSKGVWHDVVFRVYWSDDSTGYLEAWFDGKRYTPFNGTDYKFYKPNLYNRSGNYFKFGQYKGKVKPTAATIVYFDEVKIGSTYNEVRP
jgi:hypothetical protein